MILRFCLIDLENYSIYRGCLVPGPGNRRGDYLVLACSARV
jgi:hypothetical protein